jgi:hypothetical protein
MSITNYIPTQEIIFEPYSQKFYSYYDGSKVNYYITPDFGKITKLLGNNIILEGLEISNIANTTTNISCTIGIGRLIIDNTYIEISSTTDIEYSQANVLDDSGFFVLSARFINYNTLRQNELTYHLTYFTSSGIPYHDFDTSKNLIILSVFNFEKTGDDISSFSLYDIDNITLDGVEYNIRNEGSSSVEVIVDGGLIDYEELDTSSLSSTNNLNELLELLKTNSIISPITIT